MKQHITKEQWNELTNIEQQRLCDIIKINYTDFNHQRNTEGYLSERLNIGGMIEFLGYNFNDIVRDFKNGQGFLVGVDGTMTKGEELVDALWEAVKYKLK